jgi:hypothetical protein
VSLSGFVAPQRLHAVAHLLKQSRADVESQITGTSMCPTLPAGSLIRIACTNSPDPKAGDIVAFFRGDRLTAHRVVSRGRGARGGEHVITRGDAVAVCDPPTPLAAMIGHVTAWRPTSRDPWAAVGPAPPRPALSQLVARAFDSTVARLLELHPPLARWVAARALWLRNRFLGLARRLR